MNRSERGWTIVSMMYRDPCPVTPERPWGWEHRRERYVVETGLKSEAKLKVALWVSEDSWRAENLHEVHYYSRNYVDLARELRAANRIIGPVRAGEST